VSVPGKPFQASLIFVCYAKSLPDRGVNFRVGSWPYPQDCTRLERLAFDNHSNLFQTFVNYRWKKFFPLLHQLVQTGQYVIKLFCPKFTNVHNKLECPSLVNLSRLMSYLCYAKSLPDRGVNFRVGSWPYPQDCTRLKRLAFDKHSNLLQTFVNYGRKKFYNIGPSTNRSICYKKICP
jgi:hypothetical protein